MYESNRLKKLRIANGESAITYSQFQLIEEATEDVSKVFRMGMALVFNPRFFIFINIVKPLVAASDPFAWRAYPSTFSCFPDELEAQTQILNRRKLEVASSFLLSIRKEATEALTKGNTDRYN